MRDRKDLRVFFALWPDDDTRLRLHRCALSLALDRRARRVPDYNLHLTLHFIGNIHRAEIDCLQQRAREVVGQAFELIIDHAGSFPKPRVAWFGCSEPPQALIRLHEDLGRRLRSCGFKPEKRRFQPHLTVARKITAPPPVPAFDPVAWRVGQFALIESRAHENGVKYDPVEVYPLI